MNLKLIAITTAALIVLLFASFTAKDANVNAKATMVNDVYVFYMAEPAYDYEVLGTIGNGVTIFGLPSELLKSTTKRAKNKYPEADGIVYLNQDMTKASVIKFK